MPRRLFDAHCDTLLHPSARAGFVTGSEDIHVDLPTLIRSSVSDQVMAVCVEACVGREKEMWDLGLANYSDFRVSRGARLHFALEGCLPFHKGWEMPFHPIVASLTWNGDSPYAGGIASDLDLTREGRELALLLERQSTFLDVSHLNDRSRKSLLLLGLPVCATHCNARRLCGNQRNLPDEDLREVALSGGVVGVTFVPEFLEEKPSKASIESVVNHIEYIAEKTSIENVGFGSDFDGVKKLPRGIHGAQSWHSVIDALVGRGWPDEDIDKVSGDNWRRFFHTDREFSD